MMDYADDYATKGFMVRRYSPINWRAWYVVRCCSCLSLVECRSRQPTWLGAQWFKPLRDCENDEMSVRIKIQHEEWWGHNLSIWLKPHPSSQRSTVLRRNEELIGRAKKTTNRLFNSPSVQPSSGFLVKFSYLLLVYKADCLIKRLLVTWFWNQYFSLSLFHFFGKSCKEILFILFHSLVPLALELEWAHLLVGSQPFLYGFPLDYFGVFIGWSSFIGEVSVHLRACGLISLLVQLLFHPLHLIFVIGNWFFSFSSSYLRSEQSSHGPWNCGQFTISSFFGPNRS